MNILIPAIVVVIVVASIINVARQADEMQKPTIARKILKSVGLYQEPQKPQARGFEYAGTDKKREVLLRKIDLREDTQNPAENTKTPPAEPSPSPAPLSDEPPPPPILGSRAQTLPPPPPIETGQGSISNTISSFLRAILDWFR